MRDVRSGAPSLPSGLMRRLWPTLLLVLLLLAATAGTAAGHATLVRSDPPAGGTVEEAPAAVRLVFSEPVQLLAPEDVDVVDEDGEPVSSAGGRVAADRRVIEVPLQPGLPDGTYTVFYRVIGADSHVIPSLFPFGIGVEPGPPVVGDAGGGPSETGPWGVAARFLELVTLGGLFGLIAFRWAVWTPAWRRAEGVPDGERDRLVTWWRDTHWMAFGVLALAAMVAQGLGLLVQTAIALGVGVMDAARDTAGISTVLDETDFGGHVQVRAAVLFFVFALGALQFMREYGTGRASVRATVSGGPWAALVIGALVLAVIGSISAQGHAGVSEAPWLQVGAQLVHIGAAAIWVAGLALVGLVLARAPRLAPVSGRGLAGHVLLAFSAAATLSILAIAATGVVRTVAELGDPAELWATGYGRSILIKLGLLVPLVALALHNRRVLAALRGVERPNVATVALVRRTVGAELAIALAIVLVATLLVAQVPGG